MGLGDQILATGMARGAAARGKRIAFGDGKRIFWDKHSELIFRNNPNIAYPTVDIARAGALLEWIPFYKGSRQYNKQDNGKWLWNYQFRAKPGEVFLSSAELAAGRKAGRGFVVIEPDVPSWKACGPNKQWPLERYNAVALELRRAGYDVVQFRHARSTNVVSHARHFATADFRLALAALGRAALYIGPEGGLHHGAAAVGIPAVVLFGGFVPPAVTGYAGHVNLTGGAEACGSINPCQHCRDAMAAISAEQVTASALNLLGAP